LREQTVLEEKDNNPEELENENITADVNEKEREVCDENAGDMAS
jgi:hypothetical protein